MPASAKALPAIDTDRCTGCGRCVGACPPHVLSLEEPRGDRWGRKHALLHDSVGCTGCALCFLRCPFDAIRMQAVRARAPGPQAP